MHLMKLADIDNNNNKLVFSLILNASVLVQVPTIHMGIEPATPTLQDRYLNLNI